MKKIVQRTLRGVYNDGYRIGDLIQGHTGSASAYHTSISPKQHMGVATRNFYAHEREFLAWHRCDLLLLDPEATPQVGDECFWTNEYGYETTAKYAGEPIHEYDYRKYVNPVKIIGAHRKIEGVPTMSEEFLKEFAKVWDSCDIEMEYTRTLKGKDLAASLEAGEGYGPWEPLKDENGNLVLTVIPLSEEEMQHRHIKAMFIKEYEHTTLGAVGLDDIEAPINPLHMMWCGYKAGYIAAKNEKK